jgi:hypothetical protein
LIDAGYANVLRTTRCRLLAGEDLFFRSAFEKFPALWRLFYMKIK